MLDSFKTNMPLVVDAVHTVTGGKNNYFYLVQWKHRQEEPTPLAVIKITFHPTKADIVQRPVIVAWWGDFPKYNSILQYMKYRLKHDDKSYLQMSQVSPQYTAITAIISLLTSASHTPRDFAQFMSRSRQNAGSQKH